MIRVAQAASSEYFSAWGVPPNQRRTGVTTGKPYGNLDGELSIEPFYSGWTACYRCTDSAVAEKIAWMMERAVANWQHIGYGQNNGNYPRTGVFDLLQMMATKDPLKISRLCNCDCSSLVGAAVYHAGVKDQKLRDMWTGSMRSALLGTGMFVELTDSTLLKSAQGIKRGDILWKAGHTVVALDSDKNQETIPSVIWNCKACNLRTGAGTEYDVVTTLDAGERVSRISTAPNGWVQVKARGKIGFVSPKYVKPLSTMKATGNVWLRTGAGTNYSTVIVIPKGATVYTTGKTKKLTLTTWYNVIYSDREGWASGRYLTRS